MRFVSDVNECATNNGGCHSARACTNTPGSRTCGNCAAGWTNNGPTGCTGSRAVGMIAKVFLFIDMSDPARTKDIYT